MLTPRTAAFASPLADRDRTLVLAGILLALFLAALDQTIVSTALPRIVEDLEGVSRYAWVATAYLLASTALVPLYGKLADTYPRKHVELGAVSLFLAGSFLCGLAGEFGTLPLLGDGMRQLVLFRGIQGAGGAGLMSMSAIVIADLYTPAERGRYQGLVGGVWGIASVLGPLVGGLLTDHAGGLIPGVEGWRWVFYVNMPLGLLALWFIVRKMPRLEPHGERVRPDLAGAMLLLAGLVPLILSLQRDPRHQPALSAGLFVVGAAMLVGFWHRARRARSPILDLSLFDNVVFRRANASQFFYGATFMSIVIFLPLFLVNVLGVSATRAGAAMIPYTLGLVVGSIVSGQVVSRVGHLRDLVVGGGVILLAAVGALALIGADVAYGQVTLIMMIAGLGMGPSMPLFTLAIQNAVDLRRLGQATSATQFFRQMGSTVGAAVMGVVLAASLAASFAALELPSSLIAGDPASVDRMAASGGATLPERVRDAYAGLAAEVSEAVLHADAAAMASLARHPDLPGAVAGELRVLASGERGKRPRAASPGAEREAATLAGQVSAAGEVAAAQAGEGVRQAFARAAHRIYVLSFVLMLVALALALRVPELPLRKTHDRVVVAE
ncbi:MAG: MDR family MFS transporter [Longimicrobiales bacterium]